MWHVYILIFAFLAVPDYVNGSLADELAETTQLCCNQGTTYARNHSAEDCSSSIPPDVPSAFGNLCLIAMDQCCKEYFVKKKDCDYGIEIASSDRCYESKDSVKYCCNECSKGAKKGSSEGEAACSIKPRGNSAEELMAYEAYVKCCKQAAQNSKGEKPASPEHNEERSSTSKPTSTIASLCEEYAPNELCAHHCIPVPGSYKCQCNPGFRLMADGRNCMEVVKNRCKPRNPCQHKCNDNGVEVKCSCRRGYQLKADGKSCEDIDECTTTPPVCLPNTQCYNVQGSYKCIPLKKNTNPEKGQCPPGFTKNPNNNACDDINECTLLNPPCASYLCENTIGGYKCDGVTGDPSHFGTPKPTADDRCPPGFKASQNEECEDVDECVLQKDDCNRLSQFCINTRGSFHCQNKVSKHCPPGFKIDPHTNKCEDINECDEAQDICRPDQICVNVPGEYDCKLKDNVRRKSTTKCPEGFRMKPGSTRCEDIDECVEGTHLCDQHQNCLNTNGSHECNCKLGYELDPITGACADINECATEQHNCITGSQRCDNTVGSFLCVRFTPCGTGYILHHTTSECEDIDECALGIHNCDRAGPEYHCENHPGSFRCIKKRRTTTSTTTAAPEYEYEYYDSEEEVETNQTKSNNQTEVISITTTTTTTTTARPEPPSPTPREEPSIDIRLKEEDNRVEVTNTPEPERPTYPPQYERPDNREPDNKQPENRQPENRQPKNRAPENRHPKNRQPENSRQENTQPENRQPENRAPENRQPENRQPENRETENRKPEIPNEPRPDQTETTYKPDTKPSPKLVYVNVEHETATVEGEKKADGSVVVNTGDVPKNEWTKINERPSDCQIGFEMDDYGACFDIDECSTNRHSCSGLTEVCRNTMGGYLCDCAPGFMRDLISGNCVISTTSTSTTATPPVSKKTYWGYPINEYPAPTSRPFRPRTLCDVGFHLNSKTGKCEDINECINGPANCADAEICVNTHGGYRCECLPNWKLDEVRHRCVPNRNNAKFPSGYENEPVYTPINGPPASGQDFNGPKYVEPEITPVENDRTVITCPAGYKLGYDNSCEDIDECATGQAKCGEMICTNLPGGYVCSCPAGHKLIGENRCEDVDECALGGSLPVCSQNADCVNTVGSYRCKCHKGFRSAPVNDKVCVDMDECTEAPSGSLCQHRCNNVWGGYRCSCHKGYRLNPDNSTCSDIDECKEYKSRNPCIGRCVNEPGSYRCSCPSGYRLSEDKRSCIDIDECYTGEAPCSKEGIFGGVSDVCLNTRGGYRCHRIACPPGYKLEGKHRCTRIEKICPPSDWDCAHQPTTYSYNFITFVSNLYIPASKVDLFTMRGPAWPNAKMRFQLRLADVNAPPTVKEKADISAFLLVQTGNQAVMSLVRSLEGPQSIELELSMDLYNGDTFGGIAVAKLFIYVSEYEF